MVVLIFANGGLISNKYNHHVILIDGFSFYLFLYLICFQYAEGGLKYVSKMSNLQLPLNQT